MAIADGLDTYRTKQLDERDRLVATIARFQADIDSMQAKIDAIEAELPDIEAAMIDKGKQPVPRPRPVIDKNPLQPTRKP